MLRTFRKYRRSIFGMLAIAMVALAMSGFGVNFVSRQREPYAVKVDDTIVSFSDFENQKRVVEANYRARFGKNYPQIAEALKASVKQEALDRTISQTVLKRYAESMGMYAGDAAVKTIIATELFPDGFDMKRYSAFLRDQGLSSQKFEAQLRDEALVNQLVGLFSNASFASRLETQRALEIAQTSYDVQYLEFNPEKFLTQVEEPAPDQIEAHYNDNASEFELPARVSYEYVVFDPKQFESLVEVMPDDIEFSYTENLSRYTLPEQVKARHIQFTLPSPADGAKVLELKEKAQQAHERAVAESAADATSFSRLASEYSDDVATAVNGGELGWVTKGKMSKAFDTAVFKLQPGEVSELIETPSGFQIVLVEEHKPATERELSEVRGEIETEIRKREAPAYASSKAHDLFDEWKKSRVSLQDLAHTHNLSLVSSGGPLDKSSDPSDLKGLSAGVLEGGGDDQQLIEVGDKSVLVSVIERKEEEIAPLSQVRERIIDLLKREASKKLANDRAQALLDQIGKGEFSSLAAGAKTLKLELKEEHGLQMTKTPGIFSDPTVRSYVFSTTATTQKPQLFKVGGKSYLVGVGSVTRPNDKNLLEKLPQEREQESRKLASVLTESVVSVLKQQAKVDIDPAVL